MKLLVEPLTAEQVRAFMAWEYAGSYAVYNMAPENEEDRRFFLDPENGYFGICNESGELLGFCNFGADARVPGGDYGAEAVDIGMGMRPDLTGREWGWFMRQPFSISRWTIIPGSRSGSQSPPLTNGHSDYAASSVFLRCHAL